MSDGAASISRGLDRGRDEAPFGDLVALCHRLVALTLAACLGSCADAPPRQPTEGGTVLLIATGAPTTANPLLASDAYSQEMTRALLFLPLVSPGPDLRPEPRLAAEWRLEGDTAVVFRLEPGVRWSDGAPVSSADVEFTLRRALDPETGFPNRAQLEHVDGVEVLDSLTVRLRLAPVREPLLGLALLPIVPRHVLESIPGHALPLAGFNRAPVVSGPYRVVAARPGEEWRFAAREDYPATLGGPPRLSRIVWRAVPESSVQVAELQTGEADLLLGARPADAERLEASGRFRILEAPSSRYTFVAWNARRFPLSDTRVRRALSAALDRSQIVTVMRRGRALPSAGPIPPSHWAHAQEIRPTAYDTAFARRLLGEAGFTDGDRDGVLEDAGGYPLRLDLLLPAGSDFNRDLAQMLQAQLASVGVAVRLRPLEFATLIEVITGADRDFDAVLLALDADPRLDLRSLFHSESLDGPFQLAGYSNPELDRLLDSIERMPRRAEARSAWREVQRILARDEPWAFLYHATEIVVVRRRVVGVEADIRGVLFSAPAWSLREADAGTP